MSLEVLVARGRADRDLVDCLLINMTSAITIATLDGTPLSGAWS